jgi:hypothetical protein
MATKRIRKKSPEYIKITVFPVAGEAYDDVLPHNTFIPDAGKVVEGFVASVKSTRIPGMVLLVDEDAALKQKPRNALASMHHIYTAIYGPCILLTEEAWKDALRST